MGRCWGTGGARSKPGSFEAIERLQAGRLDGQVDRRAQHAQRGEVWDKALTYAQQAGRGR